MWRSVPQSASIITALDLAQLVDRQLRPLGQLLLGQAGLLPQPPDCPA